MMNWNPQKNRNQNYHPVHPVHFVHSVHYWNP